MSTITARAVRRRLESEGKLPRTNPREKVGAETNFQNHPSATKGNYPMHESRRGRRSNRSRR